MAMAKASYFSSSLLLALMLLANYSAFEVKGEEGIYELKRGDFSAKFTNYGATMLSLILPDKNGKLADVLLGYDTISEYKNGSAYFGALIGRVANRIGGAQFTLNGTVFKLVANEGNNTLHGGKIGFSKVTWTVQSYQPDSHVTFTYDSYNGEQGFPGDLAVSVTYMIIETNKLGVLMTAKALDKATPVNLILHAYWNLAGHNSGDILSQVIQLFGSKVTPVDDELIPTGEIMDMKGSAYDFLQPRKIGSRINELPSGYDINYVLDDHGHEHLNKVAVVEESISGRKMELWSNQPGVQFYTSNSLANEKGKGGVIYSAHAGFCLETQGFPDSVNHPKFPSQIINRGEIYKHVMVFRFTAV